MIHIYEDFQGKIRKILAIFIQEEKQTIHL